MLASAFQDTGDLPPFLTAQLAVPLRRRASRSCAGCSAAGGGRWDVVDAALRFRPPASTEQVMHPDKYLRVEQPGASRCAGRSRRSGPGWRGRARAARMGEWMTEPLACAADRARRAAGWGGDAYALLRRGDRRALVARWVWDTPAERARVRGGAARLGARARAGGAGQRRGRGGDAGGHG